MATPQTDVIADASDLSCFADSSVKVVYSSRSLQHVPNDVQAFSEINRVLTCDGIAIIQVASFWNASLSVLLNWLGLKTYSYRTFHVYTKKGLQRRLVKSGLHLVTLGNVPTLSPLFHNHLAILVKGGSAKYR